MSYEGAIDRIVLHLNAARDAVNAAYPERDDFSRAIEGEPPSVSEKMVALMYGGDQESSTGGNTLTQQNIQEKLAIRWQIPLVNRTNAKWMSEVERTLRLCNRETQARLLGDAHLQQNDVIGLEITSSETAFLNVAEAWARILTIQLLVDMPWVAPIAI